MVERSGPREGKGKLVGKETPSRTKSLQSASSTFPSLSSPRPATSTPLRSSSLQPHSMSIHELPTALAFATAFGIEDEKERYKTRFADPTDIFSEADSMASKFRRDDLKTQAVLVSPISIVHHCECSGSGLELNPLSLLDGTERVWSSFPSSLHSSLLECSSASGANLLVDAADDDQVSDTTSLHILALLTVLRAEARSSFAGFLPSRSEAVFFFPSSRETRS